MKHNETPRNFLHIHRSDSKQCYWIAVNSFNKQYMMHSRPDHAHAFDANEFPAIMKYLNENVQPGVSLDIFTIPCNCHAVLNEHQRELLNLQPDDKWW